MDTQALSLVLFLAVILIFTVIIITMMNKRMVKLKVQNKAKTQAQEHLLLKYYNLKRASILTSDFSLEYNVLGKGNETLFRLQKELTKDPTKDYILDTMKQLRRFIDIAKQTEAEIDISRVGAYCDSLHRSKIISFYERKDG